MKLTEKEYAELCRKMKNRGGVSERLKEAGCKPVVKNHAGSNPAPSTKTRQPNKTELEYSRILEAEFGVKPRYEAITLKLENNHRYTPDWCLQLKTGQILLVEVKSRGMNGFRQFSYGRAKMAYNQAKIDFPAFLFRWAERYKGVWNVG